jgi:hypothetical protein
MRSILLGVIVFNSVPMAEKATTNQMALSEKTNSFGKYIPDLLNTITVNPKITSAFTKATTYPLTSTTIFTRILILRLLFVSALWITRKRADCKQPAV